MTFREYFTRYAPEGFATFERDWGLSPADLDTEIDGDYVFDQWLLRHGPSARAYHYLQSLDLGPALRGRDAVGGLDFREEWNMAGSGWVAVSPQNEVTLSLLQQRLNDLGTGLRIVL